MAPDLVKYLNEVANKALHDPDVKEKILSQGNEVGGGTPQDFVALVKSEEPEVGEGGQRQQDDRGLIRCAGM
jgi:tripartite-type tricarboxylate transporter receptor subunit TctC